MASFEESEKILFGDPDMRRYAKIIHDHYFDSSFSKRTPYEFSDTESISCSTHTIIKIKNEDRSYTEQSLLKYIAILFDLAQGFISTATHSGLYAAARAKLFEEVDRIRENETKGTNTDALKAVAARRSLSPVLNPTRLISLVRDFQLLESDEQVIQFLCQHNTCQGLKVQYSLASGQSNCGKILRRQLSSLIAYEEKEWLKQLDFAAIDVANDKEYVSQIAALNANVAAILPRSPMREFAIADFSSTSKKWTGLISNDPETVSSHLKYSNELIAQWVFQYLEAFRNQELTVSQNREASKSIGMIRPNDLLVVEGGVGGGHTVHYMLRELCNNHELNFKYLGFEIVPQHAHSTNELLLNRGAKPAVWDTLVTSVSDRFSPLLIEDERLIRNLSMEDGVQSLLELKAYDGSAINSHLSSSSIVRRLDAFVSSYAFHHVPNGRAIKNYFTGEVLGAEYSTLFRDPNRKRIVEKIKVALESIVRKASWLGGAFTLSTPNDSIGPDEAFISMVEPVTLVRNSREIIGAFEKIEKTNWRISPELLDWFLNNPQKQLLSNVFQLLRPGGVVAIADPDGLSSFNGLKVKDDPELTIANFNSREELEQMLKDCGFVIKEGQTVRKVDGVFGVYSGPTRFGQVNFTNENELPDDENLGYIVVAQKPF
jgi:hypothetical protein